MMIFVRVRRHPFIFVIHNSAFCKMECTLLNKINEYCVGKKMKKKKKYLIPNFASDVDFVRKLFTKITRESANTTVLHNDDHMTAHGVSSGIRIISIHVVIYRLIRPRRVRAARFEQLSKTINPIN